MKNKLCIIKLGGSVITHKNKPLSANQTAIKKISKILGKLDTQIIIVHGGGSYGHYWSMKYDMHTKHDKYDPQGISKVHSSMLTLNKIVVDCLENERLNPYGILPSAFLINGKPNSSKILELNSMTKYNIIPVTFGDIVYIKNNNYSILSGDVLMTILSNILNPSKIIFTINVDGLYNNMVDKRVIKEINFENKSDKQFPIKTKISENIKIDDVTGGIRRKIIEATKIARTGKNVIFLNGFNPFRIEQALNDKKFKGTIFKGMI